MDDLVVSERITIPAAELRVSFARSGGPGGQNVNKVETKVELRWTPAETAALNDADKAWLLERLQGRLTGDGEFLVTSSRTRDQTRNREDARQKLAEALRKALTRPKRRRTTKPSRGAIEKRLEQKKQTARKKESRRAGTD